MRCRNHESRAKRRRRRNVERRKFAGRIEVECVAIMGVQLANTVATGETNSHRPRYRFARPNTTTASRSRSRHLYDQSSAADRSRSAVNSGERSPRRPGDRVLAIANFSCRLRAICPALACWRSKPGSVSFFGRIFLLPFFRLLIGKLLG